MRPTLATLLALLALPSWVAAWELPPDKATFGKDAIAEVLAGNDYPPTSGYTQRVDMIDFDSYGQRYTQVVVTLVPDHPRLLAGKRIVVVGGEPAANTRWIS